MPLDDNPVVRFDKFLSHLQIEVEVASPEYSRVRMPLTDIHTNTWGSTHGGILCSLLDIVFGIACNDGRETQVVTLSMSIDFLRAGLKGPLVAEARPIRIGNHIVNYEAKILDADNRVITQALISGYATQIKLPKVYKEELEEEKKHHTS